MKIRISTGSLRGRIITIPDEHADFRPTKDMVRQAILNALGPRIPGARCADVCAGCGAMGFEFLSRGAASVDFVETDMVRSKAIMQHAKLFDLLASVRLYQVPARQFASVDVGLFDILFFDPPYADATLAALTEVLCPLLAPDGVLVYERERTRGAAPPPALPPGFSYDARPYGKTEILSIRRT